uniref:Sulfatase domain-containing protein n=2 Tax=Bursaphelenchus xylophilus TaxID=6326 RepID=A0A1I7S5N3_BURXY
MNGRGRVFYLVCMISVPLIILNQIVLTTRPALVDTKNDELEECHASCRLPEPDPFNPAGRTALLPDYNPLWNCTNNFEVRSKLKNGVLTVEKRDDEQCFYSCLEFRSDTEFNYTDRLEVHKTSSVDCEVVEVNCTTGNETTYHYLHVQLIEKPPKPVKSPANASNVFIVLIDSISTDHFKRALPQTRLYLERFHGAVTFNYLNKIGLNTRPNAYAFLLNEIPESLPGASGKFVGREKEICQSPLDNFTDFVGHKFMENGYRGFMIEDSGVGVFNSPNCIGFTKQPMDHYIKQWARRLENLTFDIDYELYDNLHANQCKDSYETVLDSFQDFSKLYPAEAKFGISALVHIAHNNLNGLYRTDLKIKRLLQSMEEELDNSFFIMMADHGPRIGPFRRTSMGEYEDNNPFFVMTIPKRLRENKSLQRQLKINANELLSHYDIYATLLELATHNHMWNTDTDYHNSNFSPNEVSLKGSSLFHPLPSPRDCDSLRIPFQYCLCQKRARRIQNTELYIRAGNVITSYMNEQLNTSKFAGNCLELKIDEDYEYQLHEFDVGNDDEQVYRVKIRVKPSGGFYEAFFTVSKDDNLTLINTELPRIDAYKQQASCIPSDFLQNYCYCPEASRTL